RCERFNKAIDDDISVIIGPASRNSNKVSTDITAKNHDKAGVPFNHATAFARNGNSSWQTIGSGNFIPDFPINNYISVYKNGYISRLAVKRIHNNVSSRIHFETAG